MANPPFQATPTDSHTLRLVGELDVATVPVLEAALESMPAEGVVMLDLSDLVFVDSSGLHTFALYAESRDGHGPLVLANAPDHVASLFPIVGFDKMKAIEIQ